MFTKIDDLNPVSIRLAGPGDEAAVERLAALETREAPAGDLLLAENGREVVAALLDPRWVVEIEAEAVVG